MPQARRPNAREERTHPRRRRRRPRPRRGGCLQLRLAQRQLGTCRTHAVHGWGRCLSAADMREHGCSSSTCCLAPGCANSEGRQESQPVRASWLHQPCSRAFSARACVARTSLRRHASLQQLPIPDLRPALLVRHRPNGSAVPQESSHGPSRNARGAARRSPPGPTAARTRPRARAARCPAWCGRAPAPAAAATQLT
jgi:hypothetical protein